MVRERFVVLEAWRRSPGTAYYIYGGRFGKETSSFFLNTLVSPYAHTCQSFPELCGRSGCVELLMTRSSAGLRIT